MHRLLFLLFIYLFHVSVNAQNDFGVYAAAVFLQLNQNQSQLYSCKGIGIDKIDNTNFEGNLGAFERYSGDLRLTGGEIKSWRKDNTNLCGGQLHYIIYKKGKRPSNPKFASFDLSWKITCNFFGTYSDFYGPCSDNDIKWKHFEKDINLTQICSGTYTIELYFSVLGSTTNPKVCDKRLLYLGQKGNYSADFTITEKQPRFMAKASKYTLNEGDSLELFSMISETSYTYTYTWKGDHFTSTNPNPIIQSIRKDQSGTYQVVATDPCGQQLISELDVVVIPKKTKEIKPNKKEKKIVTEQKETTRKPITTIDLSIQKIKQKETLISETETLSRPVFSEKDKLIAAKKNSRKTDEIAKITFKDPSVKVFINDFGVEDGDLVTLFYNHKIIASEVLITKKGESFTFKLDPEAYQHELFFVAENLGKIAPNTGKVTLKVDDKTYRHHISTTDESNVKFVFVKKK